MTDPIKLFSQYYSEVQKSGILEPTAMTLATADKSGKPSSRVVLLKSFDERGFTFFTNSLSRKGKELKENPHAALLFYWMDLKMQVRIEGKISVVSAQESDEYYNSRALERRIGAWASKQSEVLETEDALVKRFKEFEQKYGKTPPRPSHWHGYRVAPEYFEFWKEGAHRLHTREVFQKDGKGWKIWSLYP